VRIEYLALKAGKHDFIFEQGDIDGQVKTLFDALKIPAQAQGVDTVPLEDETPFFCLLEDDRLISDVRVTTDELLLLPNEKEVKANDAFAIIHVKLDHKTPRTFDKYF
jgi:hypothetical protein